MEARENTAKIFDAIASSYDAFNAFLSLGTHNLLRSFVLKRWIGEGQGLLLDLGTGTGDLALLASRLGYKTLGLDPSLEMLTASKKKGLSAVVAGFGEELPFSSNSFDAAASAFVLRNLKDLRSSLKELHRVLKPGGKLALLDLGRPETLLDALSVNFWLKPAASLVGRIAHSKEEYRYLPRSLMKLPRCGHIVETMRECGFLDAEAHHLLPPPARAYTATNSV